MLAITSDVKYILMTSVDLSSQWSLTWLRTHTIGNTRVRVKIRVEIRVRVKTRVGVKIKNRD